MKQLSRDGADWSTPFSNIQSDARDYSSSQSKSYLINQSHHSFEENNQSKSKQFELQITGKNSIQASSDFRSKLKSPLLDQSLKNNYIPDQTLKSNCYLDQSAANKYPLYQSEIDVTRSDLINQSRAKNVSFLLNGKISYYRF